VTGFQHWAQMGGYAPYVWPAYGVALVVLGGMLAVSLRSYRASRRRLAQLQAGREEGP
jgi:heme exporter protein D